jgi:hypothetical protein
VSRCDRLPWRRGHLRECRVDVAALSHSSAVAFVRTLRLSSESERRHHRHHGLRCNLSIAIALRSSGNTHRSCYSHHVAAAAGRIVRAMCAAAVNRRRQPAEMVSDFVSGARVRRQPAYREARCSQARDRCACHAGRLLRDGFPRAARTDFSRAKPSLGREIVARRCVCVACAQAVAVSAGRDHPRCRSRNESELSQISHWTILV